MSEDRSKTTKSTKNRAFIYDLVLISVSAALITICSWISIPLGPVPFTLQTLGILAVMLTIGGRRGTIAILVYLALGAVGVPVFAGFGGGVGILFGSTGGYIWGFLLIGLIYILFTRLFGKKIVVKVAALILGLIVCYAFGTAWFMHVYIQNSI